MKAKEYIRDNGKVRYCDSNIAKMNIFEFIKHFVKWNKFLFPISHSLKDIANVVIEIILIIISIPFGWMISLYGCYYRIREAKKEVNKHLMK